MKVQKFDGSWELRVLVGMMTCDPVVSRIAAKWTGNMFQSAISNKFADWCIGHYRKYSKAPRQAIESYFESWVEEQSPDKVMVQEAERLLGILSDKYHANGEINSAQLIDLAAKNFHRVRLIRLADAIHADADSGKLDRAEERLGKHSKIEMGEAAGIDLFLDREAVESTYNQSLHKPLVKYEGEMGVFFSGEMEREGFLCFTGPQKSGKTYWLMSVAWAAVMQKRRVAFFEIGDLAEWQVKDRFSIRAAGHPARSRTGKWPCMVKVPTSVTLTKKEPRVTYDEIKFDGPLTGRQAWRAFSKIMKSRESNESPLRISTHPNLSISADGIRSITESWIAAGWSPDVLVIDYPDNLSPVRKENESRNEINTTWKMLRAMAQQLRCLVVVATQVKASGFTKKWLDRSDFAEDNRKLNHVTGMVGINVTAAEKAAGVTRLNWVIKREGEYRVADGPTVAGCLALANPCVCWCW